MIEFLYVFCGLALPFFYAPQIVRLARDQTKLAGYSLSKSVTQFALRLPALFFVVTVVQNPLMNLVVGLDVLGRAVELGVALWSTKRQGVSLRSIGAGWLANIHPLSAGWRRVAAIGVACGSLAVFVSHAIDDTRHMKNESHQNGQTQHFPDTGGFLDSQ